MKRIDLAADLRARVQRALGELPSDIALTLQPPKDRKHGDVALPCFQVAKARGQAPPAVAAEIAQAFAADDLIESATAAGPFVNFRFRRAALAEAMVTGALHGRPPFGPAPATGERVVIDFSSPNIAKPFHMGHLRSTVIGMALVRIHRHLGHEVHGINHLGDWGAQFGKMITAFEQWGSEEELRRRPMEHMFDLYVRYTAAAKTDPSLDERSAEHFRRLESGEDNHERRMWQRLRDESLRAFAGPYRRLGVTFDHVTGESFYEDKMEAAVERVRKAGVLTLSEGAEVVDLTDQGMPPCILRKSDGTTIYHTRDLAAIFYRSTEYRFDRALYVVGAEQKLHFRQLQAVLAKMGAPEADRIEHVPFGLILARNQDTGKWEKFATRGGNAIFLDEVLDEAVARAREVIREKNPELENQGEVAEQVGVSAIVFNDLKNARIKDVKFDLEAMTNFDGETGPYVQYAIARLASILRKADAPLDGFDTTGIDFALLADAETVLLTMLDFGPAVQRAAEQNEPSIVTGAMIALAGEIHAYLKDHHVLRADPPTQRARLALVAAARQVLRTGLGLLGVAAPDRM
jgi:arginyl-tRNA synthetase